MYLLFSTVKLVWKYNGESWESNAGNGELVEEYFLLLSFFFACDWFCSGGLTVEMNMAGVWT